MSTMDVDGLNAGYAQSLLEEYLENPEGVPAEWRALFESGDRELLAALPGLARLLESLRDGSNGRAALAPPPAPAAAPAAAPPDETLLAAVAAGCSPGSPRWRGWSGTCAARSSARSNSRSRGST